MSLRIFLILLLIQIPHGSCGPFDSSASNLPALDTLDTKSRVQSDSSSSWPASVSMEAGDIRNSIKVGISRSPQVLRDKKPTDQLTKSSLTDQFITQHPPSSSSSTSTFSSSSFIPHHRQDHKQHFQHFHHYSPHHRHPHHYSSSRYSTSSSSSHFLPSTLDSPFTLASSSSSNEKLNHQTTLPFTHESLLIHESKSNLKHHNLMMNDEVKATTATKTTSATATIDHINSPVTKEIEMFPFADDKILLPVSKLTPNNVTRQNSHQRAHHLHPHHLQQQQQRQQQFDTRKENLLINSQLIQPSPEPASSYLTSSSSSSNLASASMLSSPLCPSVCQCKWRSGKKTVLCVSASLTVVPDSIESDTQVLNLNENDLNEFLTKSSTSFASLGLTNLQRIYLSRCKLTGLSVQLFSSLTNLVEVDLSSNYLTTVPIESFKNAPHLRKLSLGHNSLEHLGDNSFAECSKLEFLDLTNSSLRTIDSYALSSLEVLQVLHLGLNELTSISGETVEPLVNLKELTLHGNNWHCDCSLRPLREFMLLKNIPLSYSSYCHSPDRLKGSSWSNLTLDEFACRPTIISSLDKQTSSMSSSSSSSSSSIFSPMYSSKSGGGFNYFNGGKKATSSSSSSLSKSSYMNSVVNSGKVNGDDSSDGDTDKSEDTTNGGGGTVNGGDNDDTDTWIESGQDSDRVQVVEGEDGTLECAAESVPLANINWYRNGQIISNLSLMSFGRQMYLIKEQIKGPNEKLSKLVIINTLPKDTGRYQCRVSNKAGTVTKNVTLDVVLKKHVKDKLPGGIGSVINGDFKLSDYLFNWSGETLAGIVFGLLIVLLVIFLLVMLMVFKYKDPNRFNFNGAFGSGGGNGDHNLPAAPGGPGDHRSAVAGYTTVTNGANVTVTYGSNGTTTSHALTGSNHNSSHGSSFNLFNRFIHSSGPYVSRCLTLDPSHSSNDNNGKDGGGGGHGHGGVGGNGGGAGHGPVSGLVNSSNATTVDGTVFSATSNQVDSLVGQCPLGSTSSVTPVSTVMSKVNSKGNSQGTTISSRHLNSSPNGKLLVNEPANHLIIGGNNNHVHGGHLMETLVYNSSIKHSPQDSLTTSSSITKSNWSTSHLTTSNSDDVQNGSDILRITVNATDSLGTTDSSGLGSTTGTSSSSSTEQSTATDRSGPTVTSMSTATMNKECARVTSINVTNGNCTSSSSTSSIASTAIAASGSVFVGDNALVHTGGHGGHHRSTGMVDGGGGGYCSAGSGSSDGLIVSSKLHQSMIQNKSTNGHNSNGLHPLDLSRSRVLKSTINDDEDMDEEEIYSKRPTVKALVIQDALAKSNLQASASPIYESFHGRSRLIHSLATSGHGSSEFNPLYVNHYSVNANGINSLTAAAVSPYGTIGRYNRRFSDRSYPHPHPHPYAHLTNFSGHQAFPGQTGASTTATTATTAMAVNQLFYPNSISSTNQASVTSSSSSSSLLLHHQQHHQQPGVGVASASPNATSAGHLLRMKQLQVQQQQIQHQLDQVLSRGTSSESPYGSIIRKSSGPGSNLASSSCKDSPGGKCDGGYSVPYGSLHRTYSASLVNSLIKSTPNVVPVIPNSAGESFITSKASASLVESTKDLPKDQTKPVKVVTPLAAICPGVTR